MRRDPRGRNSEERQTDDWLAEQGELNWLDDPRRNEAAAAGGQKASAAPGSGSGPGPAPALAGRGRRGSAAGAETIARRRTAAAVAAAGLVVLTVIAVVVATSGGSSKPGPTAVAPQQSQAPTPQPATPPTTSTRPAGGAPATPARTQPTSSSSTLKVTLPPGGALSIGDSGADVVALQKALAALGLKVGQPDGSFGPTTETAVIAFQTAHGLTPDGIVGATTAQKLNQALAPLG